MILGALYDLARSRNLLDDPDFEFIPIDFVIRVNDEGKLIALIPTKDERDRGEDMAVPRQPKRANGIVSAFLADNSKYVLGLSNKPSARDAQCLAAFRGLIMEAANATLDKGLLGLVRFYDRLDENLERLFQLRPKEEWSGSERLAFARDEDLSGKIHERPLVRRYWSNQRACPQNGGEKVCCLVTGEECIPARLHGNIKGVPNTSPSGAAIVSFNLTAFETHGLSQGANAPISPAAAEGYVTALNWLLASTSTRRYRYGVRLGNDSIIVVWTHRAAPEMDMLFQLWDAPSEDATLEKLESPWKGLEPSEFDDTDFYALTLGGNKARVVVRDWMTSSLGVIKLNLRRYFEDLAIGPKDDSPIPIHRLLDSLKPPGKEGHLPPDLATRLFNCALRGHPFPRQLLSLALRRMRLPPDKKNPKGYLKERCAIIKATLIRLSHDRRIPVSLDESNSQTAYLLGRLFAVLERLQGTAQGDLNATIRDRYYGSASSNPALVFPRLLKLSFHHVAKSEEKGKWLEALKSKIMGNLPAQPFPSILPLEEQGLFTIGYYHQREDFFTSKEDREARKVKAEKATV